MYQITFGKRYKKDIKRLQRAHIDLSPLETIIDMLTKGEPLPARCKDHELKGRLKGTRECHIKSDWLLHYAIEKEELILILISTGDHREVLGIE